MRLAVATCVNLPEPDPDESLLLEALRARGVEAELVAWDDPHADWSAFDACVVRSTWNYYRARAAFLAWAERVHSIMPLWNDLEVIRWNTHKGYLRDLAARGVAITPTEWVDSPREVSDALARLDADEVVIKPAVSAASYATIRLRRDELARAEAHVASIQGDAMVQPYIRSVEGYGERSILWIDGAFTHAIRKSPRFGGEHENVSDALDIADDERALATAALAAVPHELLYARVDLARDASGAPMIMELELVEPSLFLQQSEAALTRLTDTLASRLRVRREEAPDRVG